MIAKNKRNSNGNINNLSTIKFNCETCAHRLLVFDSGEQDGCRAICNLMPDKSDSKLDANLCNYVDRRGVEDDNQR